APPARAPAGGGSERRGSRTSSLAPEAQRSRRRVAFDEGKVRGRAEGEIHLVRCEAELVARQAAAEFHALEEPARPPPRKARLRPLRHQGGGGEALRAGRAHHEQTAPVRLRA